VKKYTLLFILLLIISFCQGCQKKKIVPAQVEKEIFDGVFDAREIRFTQGLKGGTYLRADIQELDTLNIVTTRSRSVYAVLQLVFESLLSVHPVSGNISGGIAKEYAIINDGYSLLLRLNRNVFFSDGTQCDADDVMFSFEEIYMNPDVDSKKTEILRLRNKSISIEKLDNYTVQFNLPVPYRPFLYTLAHLEILPKHILKPMIQTHGIEAFNREWGNTDNGIHTIVGTGPYSLKEFKKGELIRLGRNQYFKKKEGSVYIEGMPFLDEIVELLDLDLETKLLKFQIRELDFYDINDIDIASGDFETLLANQKEGNYKIYCGGHTLKSNHFLVFNQNPKTVEPEKLAIFQNQLFRRAIAHLVDNKTLVRDIYKGYAFVDASPERSPSPFYDSIEPLDYNLQIAKDLLNRASLKDLDSDGFLDLASGNPLHFSILTNEDNPFRMKMGEMITANLRKAGLNVEFSPINYDLIATKLIDTFDWDSVIIGIEGSIEPNESSWMWESKGTYHLWYPYQENPVTEWEKRIDELFALGRTEWIFDEARGYYGEYQRIIARELPVINIAVPAALYGYRKGFGNLVPSAVSYNSLGIMPYVYKITPNRAKRPIE
jgi:peptide/nickel transport system substrate-binding protein